MFSSPWVLNAREGGYYANVVFLSRSRVLVIEGVLLLVWFIPSVKSSVNVWKEGMHWNFCLYHNDIKICTALKLKKKNIRFKHGLDTMTSALTSALLLWVQINALPYFKIMFIVWN